MGMVLEWTMIGCPGCGQGSVRCLNSAVGPTRDARRVLPAADLELAVRVRVRPLGTPSEREPTWIRDERRKVAFITRIPKPKKSGAGAQGSRRSSSTRLRMHSERKRSRTTPRGSIGGGPPGRGLAAGLPDLGSWQVTPRDSATPAALAQTSVRRPPSGPSSAKWGGGEGNLADRGRPAAPLGGAAVS